MANLNKQLFPDPHFPDAKGDVMAFLKYMRQASINGENKFMLNVLMGDEARSSNNYGRILGGLTEARIKGILSLERIQVKQLIQEGKPDTLLVLKAADKLAAMHNQQLLDPAAQKQLTEKLQTALKNIPVQMSTSLTKEQQEAGHTIKPAAAAPAARASSIVISSSPPTNRQ